MSAAEMHSGAAAPPSVKDVPAWRLVTTLAVAGALAGLLIVSVYQWAQPRIQANQALVLRKAVLEVLGAPDHYQTLYVTDGGLTATAPAGVDTLAAERVFLGFDEAGSAVGYAITGGEPGFQDVIHLIFGYDARSRQVLGMRILDHRETPGLGDKIEKDQDWLGAFEGTAAPILGVKPGAGRGQPGEVDMITGATISSRVVIQIINRRIERLQPLLDAYGGGQ
jgi:Na+-translocating ferredoxin:NAD+ oxidoreductase subunit G